MFDSRQNYMKRSEFVGNAELTLGSAGSTVTQTVTHGLGYIPLFIVGAELIDSTTIWSGNRVYEFTLSSLFGPPLDVQLTYWCTENTLTINLTNGDGANDHAGQTCTVYWVIYVDDENVI